MKLHHDWMVFKCVTEYDFSPSALRLFFSEHCIWNYKEFEQLFSKWHQDFSSRDSMVSLRQMVCSFACRLKERRFRMTLFVCSVRVSRMPCGSPALLISFAREPCRQFRSKCYHGGTSLQHWACIFPACSHSFNAEIATPAINCFRVLLIPPSIWLGLTAWEVPTACQAPWWNHEFTSAEANIAQNHLCFQWAMLSVPEVVGTFIHVQLICGLQSNPRLHLVLLENGNHLVVQNCRFGSSALVRETGTSFSQRYSQVLCWVVTPDRLQLRLKYALWKCRLSSSAIQANPSKCGNR